MKLVINPTPAQEELAKTFGHIIVKCDNYIPLDIIARTLRMNRVDTLRYLEDNYPELIKEMSLNNFKKEIGNES